MAVYQTKQQQAVLNCIAGQQGAYFTAASLHQALQQQGCRVGMATIYRQLEKLEQEGRVHKIAGEEGALFQYCDRQEHQDCFLLKCEGCGRILHADCMRLAGLYQHLEEDHHFRINPRKTVFYGLCENCQAGDRQEE